MASPLGVVRNDYRKNPKKSDIETPKVVCVRIYEIVEKYCLDILNKEDCFSILDPSVGNGNLLKPFDDNLNKFNYNNIFKVGVDTKQLNEINPNVNVFINIPFEKTNVFDYNIHIPNFKPDIVLCNPPFNQGCGRKLYAEVFLRHCIDLFGDNIPMVFIVPMGFRLNQRKISNRWKWLKDNIEISSILSLPLDIFNGVEFHCEVLFFNFPEGVLKPHYFLKEVK